MTESLSDMYLRSNNRQISVDLFAELIGCISQFRFLSVSDKFTKELENSSLLKESKLYMLIRSMRFLIFKTYPIEALEETADFMQTLANFFSKAHSIRIKHAFAELLVGLLLPMAPTAGAEVNLPSWTKAIDMIYPKAYKMTLKPRHTAVAYVLATTVMCMSKRDFFLQNWFGFVEMCWQKMKVSLHFMQYFELIKIVFWDRIRDLGKCCSLALAN